MSLAWRSRTRVPETDCGQQGEFIAEKYDEMQRHIRDSGWLIDNVRILEDCGVQHGTALEIGTGPGYLGLEWLRSGPAARNLVGVDISPAMVDVATRNGRQYELAQQARFVVADAATLPFEHDVFDAVFSAGSLHEWSEPQAVLAEITRVLRAGGRCCIIDLRRDLSRQAIQFMRANIDSELRAGFMRSVRAAYVRSEIDSLLKTCGLQAWRVTEMELGIYVTGELPALDGGPIDDTSAQ